ncbi:MAG: DUF2290 domain-containing protein [Desulfovibrio sp.]|uniref:DUF2290 domain-containing protein n=1 Tax=Desulfovibrio sp. 7SRBS1 TaxID=3378064 RepID=UPI003B3E9B8C
MNPRNFTISINKSASLFDEVGLLLAVRCPTSLRVTSDFKKLSLDRTTQYKNLYLKAIETQDYNIILRDYSFFQFSLLNISDCSVRYAFYPNPLRGEQPSYILDCNQMFEEGRLDYEEYCQLISELKEHYGVPCIRYDFSPSCYKQRLHPAAHFHIGFYHDDRWSSSIFLTPMMFSLLICNMYYFHVVHKKNDIANNYSDELYKLIKKERGMCTQIQSDYFSDDDRSVIHFR